PVDYPHLRRLLAEKDPDAIICADGGARHACKAHIMPALIVGDMDSLNPEELDYFRNAGCQIITHPAAKDETDMALAFAAALQMKPRKIWILGALGNRLDHTLANLSLLLRGAEQNIEVRIVDRWCEAFVVRDRCILEGKAGQTVSIFPFPGPARGVTLEGFEYPLYRAEMTPDHPYGISNRLLSPRGLITVEGGTLLVVRFHEPGVFPE
ncbi:MAG: thiamine diphosphokinase, partial [Syntrophales bacterium]|nr:thiamine diphosphokinase [Syntrophales bacterium]